ncbi:MAG: C4-dicarboxylate ABC transporter, partial [Burkholderiales bacterium]|nr:C4-dicarboxylate ABC transporter [Burkholderiales bacterium]
MPSHSETKPDSARPSRRRFLATAATGAAIAGFPAIVRAQAPITMRFQSTWPVKFIYHELA